MTKPWEETWEYVAHYQHIDVPEGGDIGIFVDDRVLDESEKARLRLAAQAPAMARLLLEIQWGGSCMSYGSHCPSCHAFLYDGGPDELPHAADCALVAVLRAAGVLP